MDALQLQERCKPLSATDQQIAAAITALEASLGSWLDGVRSLESCGIDVDRLMESGPPSPQPGAAPPPERTASAVPTAARPAAPATAPAVDSPVSEEELLRSLDPEIANAVRIRRRLHSGKVDLRELIREVEASVEPKKKKPRRNNWWS